MIVEQPDSQVVYTSEGVVVVKACAQCVIAVESVHHGRTTAVFILVFTELRIRTVCILLEYGISIVDAQVLHIEVFETVISIDRQSRQQHIQIIFSFYLYIEQAGFVFPVAVTVQQSVRVGLIFGSTAERAIFIEHRESIGRQGHQCIKHRAPSEPVLAALFLSMAAETKILNSIPLIGLISRLERKLKRS